ncbi:unnamed protein product, partial [Oppiella nova]
MSGAFGSSSGAISRTRSRPPIATTFRSTFEPSIGSNTWSLISAEFVSICCANRRTLCPKRDSKSNGNSTFG